MILKYRSGVTPSAICPKIKVLASSINVDVNEATYIDVIPESDAKLIECFPNVHKKIESDGGSIVHGWAIWEFPGVYVESEFHSVWQSPNGTLVDITPRAMPVSRILFIPDHTRKFEGWQINNSRVQISNDSSVIEYLHLLDKKFDIINAGDRKFMFGNISHTLSDDDKREILAIDLRLSELLEYIQFSIVETVSPYGPCICCSGKKVKFCHKMKNLQLYIQNTLIPFIQSNTRT